MRATTMVGFVFSFVFLGLLTQLAVANNRIITLQEDMERVKEESSYILESNRKVNKQDRTADGHALTEARKQLKEETQLRLDVEKELEMQIGMRQEMELAMKMLEKDVCEKQDALVVLRQQLDDLRALKLELSFKLQSSDLGMKQKSELNSRLEEKTSQMAATIKLLEQRLQLSKRECQSLQEDNRLFKEEFGDKINSLQVEVEQLTKQRGQLEVELRWEREQWLHLPHGVPDNKSLFSPNKGIQKTGSKINSSDRHLEGDSQSRASVKENTVLSSSVFPVLQDEQEQASEKSKPCQLCQEESTQSKRKNTCKNCGGVFCEDCSANELPLPSSIKPERVCNFCHKHLIQQYSASPS
uniref:FYVE-type domain-containing protein n=1 Tax=Micrurus spixii TaxID=129469 RepID=A0A2D4M7C5_9SAUR